MSGIALNKLVFDPSNMADSANIGAYLRASDGTLITHTGGALDINITNASVAVTATNLDIRDLAFATDKVDISGSTLAANSGVDIGDVTINNASGASAVNIQDGGNSITVDAVNLDIRDLVFATDKVDVSGSVVSSTPAGASASAYGATSVTTTATDLIATDLSGRVQVMLQNVGSKDVYVGSNSSVTTSNGILLAPGSSMVLDADDTINVHGITASGTASVRYFELAV